MENDLAALADDMVKFLQPRCTNFNQGLAVMRFGLAAAFAVFGAHRGMTKEQALDRLLGEIRLDFEEQWAEAVQLEKIPGEMN